MVDKELTYDASPVKAAQAVAAIFANSRAEVAGHHLYPLGARISYTVKLDGFAGSEAALKWSLWSTAGRQPLPRNWWRDVTAALIKPSVNHESISGTFWVPMPPRHGDYVVQVTLTDRNGLAHAGGESTPPIH